MEVALEGEEGMGPIQMPTTGLCVCVWRVTEEIDVAVAKEDATFAECAGAMRGYLYPGTSHLPIAM